MRVYGVRQNGDRKEEFVSHIDELQRKALEFTENLGTFSETINSLDNIKSQIDAYHGNLKERLSQLESEEGRLQKLIEEIEEKKEKKPVTLRLLSAFYHLKHTVLIYGIMNAKIKIGDSVVVKNDVRDADFPDLLLAGFQGRIIELSEDEDGNELVDIEWDSQSLRGMADYVSLCEEEELDWTTCTLFLDEVEPTEARDTPEDVRNVANELLQS